MKTKKVLILAKNLRGAYLACELAGQGFSVTLLNVHFSSKEILGKDEPFSYLQSKAPNYFQKQFTLSSSKQKNMGELTYLSPIHI